MSKTVCKFYGWVVRFGLPTIIIWKAIQIDFPWKLVCTNYRIEYKSLAISMPSPCQPFQLTCMFQSKTMQSRLGSIINFALERTRKKRRKRKKGFDDNKSESHKYFSFIYQSRFQTKNSNTNIQSALIDIVLSNPLSAGAITISPFT